VDLLPELKCRPKTAWLGSVKNLTARSVSQLIEINGERSFVMRPTLVPRKDKVKSEFLTELAVATRASHYVES